MFGSETTIVFIQLLLVNFLWDSCQYAFAAFKILGTNYDLQLQFWSFSELFCVSFWREVHQNTAEKHCRILSFLTCFYASFFPFCPLCWPPLFLSFSQHPFALFSPSKSALFCRAKGTAQSLVRGRFRMNLSSKFGKEIPSRNLLERRSVCALLIIPCWKNCWENAKAQGRRSAVGIHQVIAFLKAERESEK